MEGAPPSSRRARRRRDASPGEVATARPQDEAVGDAEVSDAADDVAAWVTTPEAAPGRRIALGWLDDDAVTARTSPPDLTDGAHPYLLVSPDLLARRPRRSPLRAGIVVPTLGAIALVGAYAATTLLWPLYAVTPSVTPVAVADLAAPATAVVWPAAGSAAIGVAGFDGSPASSTDARPMASITKLVTAMMILEQMPLAVGESGPTFAFTARDRQTYNNYLAKDESALNVPVGGTLTQYQMMQGMLIGSAGNYTDRLAGSLWPTDRVFETAAKEWLTRHNLPGITVVDPTGIDSANAGDPASLIALARLALADPVIAEIVRTPSVTLPGAGNVVNTNDLLTDPAVVGLKTGTLKGAYNLLAARDQTVGDTPVRVYAVALGQPNDQTRDAETSRLLTEVTAEASTPTVLPAGTVVGTVTTLWGTSVQIVTDADASLLLWNGASAPVTSDLSLGDARAAGAAVGTVSTKGPIDSASSGVHLAAEIPDPDAWWRLTHPLQLFGLAD